MFTFVKASCHCGANAFNIAFETDSLPISNDLCHCTSCRHSTGQLMINHVGFVGVPLAPNSTSEPADLSNLTPYKTSNIATRWFCSRCSAHILWEYNNTTEPSWCIAAGTLERTEGIVKSAYHIWVGDTLDGGIADFLPAIDGIELPRYKTSVTAGEVVPVRPKDLDTNTNPNATEDRLHAYCHCKANSFYITRPDAVNPTAEQWWFRPADAARPTHYLASNCACSSCRATCGFEIQSWVFVPPANIIFAHGDTAEAAPLDLNDDKKRPASLQHYLSSTGRHREFCGTCGATVFWWGDERPGAVDIAAGLLDEQQGGVRAEGWFKWSGLVTFTDDAINKSLVQGLAEGLKAWKKC
ncbi:hypothetical protein DXG01_006546 [Tephrocybe rancida]|nr:hypothetical protein DXG01_006546 [Tephrocybe rancida]